jgi:hypothetical protein
MGRNSPLLRLLKSGRRRVKKIATCLTLLASVGLAACATNDDTVESAAVGAGIGAAAGAGVGAVVGGVSPLEGAAAGAAVGAVAGAVAASDNNNADTMNTGTTGYGTTTTPADSTTTRRRLGERG